MWLKQEIQTDASGLSSLVLYASRVDRGVLQLYDGALQTTWHCEGADLGTVSRDEAFQRSQQIAAALNLGSDWMIEMDVCRRPVSEYPPTQPNAHPVLRLIDHERRNDLSTPNAQLRSFYHVTLTHLPPRLFEQKTMSWIAGDRRAEISADEKNRLALKSLAKFQATCDTFAMALGGYFTMRRLETDDTWDEQLRFLRECVIGEDHLFAAPAVPVLLNTLAFSGEVYTPWPTRIRGRHVRVVAADVYPSTSAPRLFAAMESLPFPCRWHIRHIQFDQHTSAKIHERNKHAWHSQQRSMVSGWFGMGGSPDKDAVAMEADAEDAEAVAKRGLFYFGDYQNKVVLWGESLAELDERTKIVQRLYTTAGFSPRVEEANSMDSIRATWPGHGYSDCRMVPVHTRNVADLMPASTPFTGLDVNPCEYMPKNSPPLMMLTTDGNTPFKYHVHNGHVGHTLLIGPTRHGKSFLLAEMAAQWLVRFEDAQVLAFDKKASLSTLNRAVGGQFYDFRPGGKPLCPLGQLDTPEDRAHAVSYVEVLYRLNGMVLSPAQRQEVSDAIRVLVDRPRRRSLTDLSVMLGSHDLSQGLSYFTAGSVSGGSMLDGQQDTLDLAATNFAAFDMDYLFELKDRRLLQATLPYLFRVVSRRLDGRPTLILFDESWMGLQDPIFEGVLKSWIKELAKLNASIILATQNLSDFSESHLRHVILDQCQTRIILATPSAASSSRDLFHTDLELTDEQCKQIAAGVPRQDCFISQGGTFRRVQVGAQGVQKAFLGANSPDEQRAFQACMKADPVFGPADWLRKRGLPEWADTLENDLRDYAAEAVSYACA